MRYNTSSRIGGCLRQQLRQPIGKYLHLCELDICCCHDYQDNTSKALAVDHYARSDNSKANLRFVHESLGK
jgi:hypothetical protein